MYQTVSLSIIRSLVMYVHTAIGVCRTGLLTACQQAVSITCMTYTCCCVYVHCQTPDDGQRNCPKHVEFYSKNKFEKLVHLIGFTIRIYHDARSSECQICTEVWDSSEKYVSFLHRTVVGAVHNCVWHTCMYV